MTVPDGPSLTPRAQAAQDARKQREATALRENLRRRKQQARSREESPGKATIIGGPASPYVRKIMAICDLKGVAWRCDPIIPFQGNEEFSRISPLRRVPVFMDDQVTLADSTAIAEYLDERYPAPALFPIGPAARAQARWLEEFGDTRMGDVLLWRIFNEAVIKPGVWRQERDEAAIAAALADDLPGVMEYLETMAPADGFLFGGIAIADISIAVHFANLSWARTDVDLGRWARTMAWVARVEAVPEMARLIRLGEVALTTRGPDRARVFGALGMEVTAETLAGSGYRRGPMSV